MRTIGEPILARDKTGRLKSPIGTLFLSVPVLITLPGVHATQRLAWIEQLNRERVKAGLPQLTAAQENEEILNSVDLLFDDQYVLIRPDPNNMAVAFQGDEILQTVVPKRQIRYLNTQQESVRTALMMRGENWRMSRLPVKPEEMTQLIDESLIGINEYPIYFYNRSTGTRFLTCEKFAWLSTLPDAEFVRQIREIAIYSQKHNRFGVREVDIFPPKCGFDLDRFTIFCDDSLTPQALRDYFVGVLEKFRAAVPLALRHETPENIEWRNRLFSALTKQPNALTVEHVLSDVSPEFYRQIEWVPGCRIDGGEIIFDAVLDELSTNLNDREPTTLVDARAKAIIFNYLREHGTIEYINIGRIGRSLSLRTPGSLPRGMVYIVHLKERSRPQPELFVLRFQKWSVRYHLDSGKELLQAAIEATQYTDYVLDRRLACRQLGMNLPDHQRANRITELYDGSNPKYYGRTLWSGYFERHYVTGCATDKLPEYLYKNKRFNQRFARLLGYAAAVNCIVGCADMKGAVTFDDGDEVLQLDTRNMPRTLVVSDHTGSFARYSTPLFEDAAGYAEPINKRATLIPNIAEFADIYLKAFERRFRRIQRESRHNRRAFDRLFAHRPLDPAGSIAYRWQCVLNRLESTDINALIQAISSHIKG